MRKGFETTGAVDGEKLLPVGGPSDEFDLGATLESGQVFHWLPVAAEPEADFGGSTWEGTIGSRRVFISQDSDGKLSSNASSAVLAKYFSWNEDFAAMRASFPRNDEFLGNAVRFCPGLRVLQQPEWECLATFICSSLKQVAHIRALSLAIRRRYAEGPCRHWRIPPFPSPEVIASGGGEEALRACGLGYRAKSLFLAAKALSARDSNLESMRSLDDAQLCDALCQFHGVGEKIAHCVMLFAYQRWGAFPVDVWVDRIMREGYFFQQERVMKAAEIRAFARDHFGPYAGLAQQYLFHFARLRKLNGQQNRHH